MSHAKSLPEARPSLSPVAWLYIALMTGLGATVLWAAAMNWETPDLMKFAGFLLIAVLCSGMRIKMPGLTGTLSLNFLFVLFGVLELSPSETIVMGAVITLIQCYWKRQRTQTLKVLFNVSAMALAIAVTEQVYHSAWMASQHIDVAIRLALATVTFF